jgi:hypothetical protein
VKTEVEAERLVEQPRCHHPAHKLHEVRKELLKGEKSVNACRHVNFYCRMHAHTYCRNADESLENNT